jgi:hypothetical protein
MRVTIHRADSGGCGMYLPGFALQTLQHKGYDVEDRFEYHYQAVMQPSQLGGRLIDVQDASIRWHLRSNVVSIG